MAPHRVEAEVPQVWVERFMALRSAQAEAAERVSRRAGGGGVGARTRVM